MDTFKYEERSTKYEVRRELSRRTGHCHSSLSVLRTSYLVLRTFSLIFAFPAIALACPVCGLGTGDNEWAYAVMSVILSALPLGMFAAGTVWLSRRVKQHDGAQGSGRTAQPDHGPASAPESKDAF